MRARAGRSPCSARSRNPTTASSPTSDEPTWKASAARRVSGAGKASLYDWLARTGGRVFVPANDPVLMSMAAERETLAAECYPTTLADGVEHHLEGDYNRFNVAAAVAVGRYFGVDDERIRYAVGSYRPDNHRSQKYAPGRIP